MAAADGLLQPIRDLQAAQFWEEQEEVFTNSAAVMVDGCSEDGNHDFKKNDDSRVSGGRGRQGEKGGKETLDVDDKPVVDTATNSNGNDNDNDDVCMQGHEQNGLEQPTMLSSAAKRKRWVPCHESKVTAHRLSLQHIPPDQVGGTRNNSSPFDVILFLFACSKKKQKQKTTP